MTWRGAGISLSVMAIVLGVAGCKSSTEPRDEDEFGVGTAGSLVTTGGASGTPNEITFIVDLFTQRMSFNARGGESASGVFNFTGKVGGLEQHIHGDILCYSISGNQARVAGVITTSDQLALLNQEALWMVEDNGEGSNGPIRDRITNYRAAPPGSAQAYCFPPVAIVDDPDMYQIETGNVQVHP
jgi:hypothetical protein